MLKRFMLEDSGMEMVEWAIVSVLFAVAGAGLWSTLAQDPDGVLTKVSDQLKK